MTMPQSISAMDIEAEIDALAALSRSELIDLWQARLSAKAPKNMSHRLLMSAIAYEMQVQRYGGLKPAVRRRLEKIVQASTAGREVQVTAASRLRPGARLIREWNGSSHVVEVIEGGYTWKGERYRSLSAVARAITGARWSGPRFFGLTSESSE